MMAFLPVHYSHYKMLACKIQTKNMELWLLAPQKPLSTSVLVKSWMRQRHHDILLRHCEGRPLLYVSRLFRRARPLTLIHAIR